MLVRVGFPLRSEGHLGRAAALASGHPSYHVEGANGTGRVCVDLDLPSDWRLLDDFSGLLRSEGDAFEVDKDAIPERVLSDLGPCVRCPILDLDSTAEIVARLPERIDPGRDQSWGYREDGDFPSWKVVKTREGREEADLQEDREGLIERLARSVRSGGAGVAAASGTAPGSRNVPATRYEDVGGMRETIDLVRESVELPITHPEIFRKLHIRPH